GMGADALTGNGGDDLLQGNAGNDALSGGTGTDTVDYAAEAAGHSADATAITVNLSGRDDVGAVTVAAGHAVDTYGDTDTLSSIETVKAGSGYGDTVALDGDPEDWAITFDSAHDAWTVTGTTPGLTQGQSYTFQGVEKLVFQCSSPAMAETVHLVDPSHA